MAHLSNRILDNHIWQDLANILLADHDRNLFKTGVTHCSQREHAVINNQETAFFLIDLESRHVNWLICLFCKLDKVSVPLAIVVTNIARIVRVFWKPSRLIQSCLFAAFFAVSGLSQQGVDIHDYCAVLAQLFYSVSTLAKLNVFDPVSCIVCSLENVLADSS